MTPIVDFLTEYAESGISRLHMPGHKGKAPKGVPDALKDMYRLDITEIAGADNLYAPEGIIAESERNAGDIFGAETYYCTEGSSLAIKAMLYLSLKHFENVNGALKPGEKASVIAIGKCHKAFYHAAELLNLEVEHVESAGDYLCDIEDKVSGPTVGVYVTYPDYFGAVTDLKAIKQKMEKLQIPLLVDGAHSAYFKFLQGEYAKDYPHPADCGADAVCTSAHKTLPALTGAAYLHLNESFKDVFPVVKHAFDIFGSSSPSYLIMASLDAFNGVAEGFKEELHSFCKEVSKVKAEIAQMGFNVRKSDPMRIVVASDERFTGEDFAKALRACKCEPECFDKEYVIMMLSPYNSPEDLSRIRDAFELLTKGKDKLGDEVKKGYDCLVNFK